MLLSVIVPAYNVAPYIQAAVRSALAQSVHDLEVIVVDDGSSDATGIILDELAQEHPDPRLKIIHTENGGVSAARNRALEMATGRYVGMLDGDDQWRPLKAERHIAVMEAAPDVALTFSNSEYINEDGSPTGRFLISDKAEVTLRDMVRRNYVGSGSSPFLRRDCLASAGLFREDLAVCEDYELWCRVLNKNRAPAVLIPEILTLYRERRGSLTVGGNYLPSVDRAMATLRSSGVNVSRHVLMAGHAEHYRIAALKALSNGHRRAATTYLLYAMCRCPWLVVTDWRAAGTVAGLFMPRSLRLIFAKVISKLKLKTTSPAHGC